MLVVMISRFTQADSALAVHFIELVLNFHATAEMNLAPEGLAHAHRRMKFVSDRPARRSELDCDLERVIQHPSSHFFR